MRIKLDECPTCGSDKVKSVTRSLKREINGEKYTVPDLTFYECPACGERLFDLDAMAKIEEFSPAYRKRKGKNTASKRKAS